MEEEYTKLYAKQEERLKQYYGIMVYKSNECPEQMSEFQNKVNKFAKELSLELKEFIEKLVKEDKVFAKNFSITFDDRYLNLSKSLEKKDDQHINNDDISLYTEDVLLKKHTPNIITSYIPIENQQFNNPHSPQYSPAKKYLLTPEDEQDRNNKLKQASIMYQNNPAPPNYMKNIKTKDGKIAEVISGPPNHQLIVSTIKTVIDCSPTLAQQEIDKKEQDEKVKQENEDRHKNLEIQKRALKGGLPTITSIKVFKNENDLKEGKKIKKEIILMTSHNQSDLIKNAFEQGLSALHYDVADAIRLQSFCSIGGSIKGQNLIYNQNTNRFYIWSSKTLLWKDTKKGKPLFQILEKARDLFVQQLLRAKTALNEDIATVTNLPNEVIESHENTIKKITSLVGKMKTVSFINSITNVLTQTGATSFEYTDIISPLIPLNDGTNFNIFTHESVPRTVGDKNRFTRCINAHIDTSIKNIIPDNNDIESPHRIIWNILFQIFCEDVEYLLYFLTIGGIYISGDLSDKTFAILSGETNAAKTKVSDLFYNVLGDLCGTIAPGLIYDMGGKSSSNAHTAEFDALKGLILGINPEAMKARGYNTKNIKSIVGGDKIYNRPCGSSISDTNIRFPLHLFIIGSSCDLPPIPFKDEVMQDYVLVFPFQAYFDLGSGGIRKGAKKTYPADRFLDVKLKNPEILNAFFTMLALSAKIYYDNKMVKPKMPKCVIDATNQYLKKSFIYDRFLLEYCDLDSNYHGDLKELFKIYSTEDRGKDNKSTFYANMRLKFGNEKKQKGGSRYFQGVKLKQ